MAARRHGCAWCLATSSPRIIAGRSTCGPARSARWSPVGSTSARHGTAAATGGCPDRSAKPRRPRSRHWRLDQCKWSPSTHHADAGRHVRRGGRPEGSGELRPRFRFGESQRAATNCRIRGFADDRGGCCKPPRASRDHTRRPRPDTRDAYRSRGSDLRGGSQPYHLNRFTPSPRGPTRYPCLPTRGAALLYLGAESGGRRRRVHWCGDSGARAKPPTGSAAGPSRSRKHASSQRAGG
ncbi:Uncharacterised protein [Burkholderia pseudomallei]|nr:Uncharacterised protein [Burkholderia pseudomallei]